MIKLKSNYIRGGRFCTGDGAIQVKDGYYRFVDCRIDMIKRSGEIVSAGEVENLVMQHPAVFEYAVAGRLDEPRDETIVAVVVLQAIQQVTESELLVFCAGKLARFRVPQRILFEESLPRFRSARSRNT